MLFEVIYLVGLFHFLVEIIEFGIRSMSYVIVVQAKYANNKTISLSWKLIYIKYRSLPSLWW